MEMGWLEDEERILLQHSRLLLAAQCSLSLFLASASHHEVHSSQPTHTKQAQDK